MVKNLTNTNKHGGFTIVELLVVIVVIGILAAITVVSYTGITAKAKTAANQQNASSIASAAATAYAESPTSTYPAATIVALNAYSAKVPANIALQGTVVTSGTKDNIGYVIMGTNAGVCVSYWDHSGAGSVKYLGVGNVKVPADGSSCTL